MPNRDRLAWRQEPSKYKYYVGGEEQGDTRPEPEEHKKRHGEPRSTGGRETGTDGVLSRSEGGPQRFAGRKRVPAGGCDATAVAARTVTAMVFLL